MHALSIMLKTAPTLFLSLIVQYRLLNRTLGRNYSAPLTLFILMTVTFFSGWLNLFAGFATDIGENALYYGLISAILYAFLFKGHFTKKIFLNVLIVCGAPILYYFFLPFLHYFFNGNNQQLIFALRLTDYINTFLCMLCFEFIGKKFQNLRRELPHDYTIYLTVVIIFAYIAVYTAYDRALMINNMELSLSFALSAAFFALIGAVIVTIAIFAVDRQVDISLKEQLDKMQAEDFKSREVEWRRFLGFRHDITNHLICLDGLLKNGKTEQAISYMQNLTDTMKQFESPVQTGNDYADALLNVKYAQAVAANISISVEMSLPAQGFISPIDLCCILSNAFDNAISACACLDEGERWIKARAFICQDQLVIEIKNSKPPYVSVVNGEVFPKEITSNHGLGLDNVKAVTEKYGGILDLSADQAFSFSVLLPALRL